MCKAISGLGWLTGMPFKRCEFWSMLSTCSLESGLFRCHAKQMRIQGFRVTSPSFYASSARLLLHRTDPFVSQQLLLGKVVLQQQHSSLYLRKKKQTCSFLMAISVTRVIKHLTPQQVLPKWSPELLSIWRPLLPMGPLGVIAIVPGPALQPLFYVRSRLPSIPVFIFIFTPGLSCGSL